MNYTEYDLDMYEEYEDLFDPQKFDRQARRKRKPQINHTPKVTDEQVLEEIVDDQQGLEGGFQTTYQPAKHEEGWLLDSLRTFYDQSFIDDILALVKGGKEASVYRCQTKAYTEFDQVAAKVYRPRMFRNLRNDKMYREGRAILTIDGREAKHSDQRLRRALDKKSSFGETVQHTSWLMYEYTTLQKLHELGADVPKPISSAPNAILMEYIGDEFTAAPVLHAIRLEEDEMQAVFERVLWNLELMLENGIIHGDLSAYNILYWDGEIRLIDFPQVTNPYDNPNSQFIFERDIQRVCDYFSGLGMECDAVEIATRMWENHIGQL